MENLIIESIDNDYVSFEDLLRLAEDIPTCEDVEFPDAGALAKIAKDSVMQDFELK
ncbi:MAG: hypothetical protein KTR16_14540 [Acidiferrobacterales bacterium]|nr:hypothetical protein [Acidiferrobacterales bacterium]